MTKQQELVLIVDDDPDMCWVLDHLLTGNGCRVIRALNGSDALKLVESHKFRLVFVDAKLPDMEGWDLAREIKSKHGSIALVMISGYCYRHDAVVQAALGEGLIFDFLPKPFLHGDVLKVVEATRCHERPSNGTENAFPQDMESLP